jgi:hypothetical protein
MHGKPVSRFKVLCEPAQKRQIAVCCLSASSSRLPNPSDLTDCVLVPAITQPLKLHIAGLYSNVLLEAPPDFGSFSTFLLKKTLWRWGYFGSLSKFFNIFFHLKLHA